VKPCCSVSRWQPASLDRRSLGGSLSSDIDQLLMRQVAGHLDSQRVVLAPATLGFTPDVQVLLTITRLDSGKATGDPRCAMASDRPSWPGAR
jgi:hypothetical protein